MKLRLVNWLTLSFFFLNFIFIGFMIFGYYSETKSSIQDRTKSQLRSVNILKKRLIRQYLHKKNEEITETIKYFESHNLAYELLVSRLKNVQDVYAIETIQKADSITRHSKTNQSGYSKNIINNDTIYSLKAEKGRGEHVLFNFYYKNVYQKQIRIAFDKTGIQDILLERTGLGSTGESYLVGADSLLLTTSRFFPDSVARQTIVNTRGVQKALNNNSGTGVYPDYRDVKIVGAFRPVNFGDLHWALMSEIDYEEAMDQLYELRTKTLYFSGVILFISLVFSSVFARSISRTINRIKGSMTCLASGALPDKHSESSNIIEIDAMFNSVNQLIDALQKTVTFAGEIGHGNFHANYEPVSEKDQLGSAINNMRNQLIELDKEKEALARQSKKSLAETQERERERLSRDLHDGLGPMLTSLKHQISRLETDDETRKNLLNVVESTIKEVRSVSHNLMPSVLVDFGVVAAIQDLTNQIRKDYNITVNFEYDTESENGIKKDAGIVLYRISQEAINNAIKHAGATRIAISLTEFESYIAFFITDNGHGFDTHGALNSKNGKGLHNMQERVSMLNGLFEIHSDQNGTSIEIEIPKHEGS